MSEPVDHLGRMMLIWNMIEAWLQIAAPESLVHLYPGATEQQLHATEAELGFSLPEYIKASWSLHNGTDDFFFDNWGFLTLERMLCAYKAQQGSEEWPATYLPFAADGAGGYLCVDMGRSKGEPLERIVAFDYELGEDFVAPDFWSLLSWFVNDLEDGKYGVDESGSLVSDDVSLGT
ncbi:hypothetical protein EPA93_04965 [Ktedonosporobacter rubrisoli]|uniref:Knr4/Smi1-like domain-containing protein n=1 Tax=Ktedonosporobacter rubrisoli TaxID=2509675 RepID=A0A4P6JL54_KTERU|nr:SMI1/KNR4 family protein [Ktedonosporobacter rubrisoli]QBD75386.1 hypothetical protein EPA93_04965 [Ktedonosporobacter rubrisoli]